MARCRHFLPLRVFGPQMKVPQMKDVPSSRDGAANTRASGASRASHHGMQRRHVALDLTFQAVTETKFMGFCTTSGERGHSLKRMRLIDHHIRGDAVGPRTWRAPFAAVPA